MNPGNLTYPDKSCHFTQYHVASAYMKNKQMGNFMAIKINRSYNYSNFRFEYRSYLMREIQKLCFKRLLTNDAIGFTLMTHVDCMILHISPNNYLLLLSSERL